MQFLDMLSLARENLRRARLRTALTATGVAIGTAAVVTLVAFGSGAENIAVRRAANYSSLTQVTVYPTDAHGNAHALTSASVSAFSRLPHVASITTQVTTPPLRLSLGGAAHDMSTIGQSPQNDSLTLIAGHITLSNRVDGVLLPASLARTLHRSVASLVDQPVTLTAGSSVCCNTSQSSVTVLGPDRHFSATIAGVYDDKALNPRDGASPPLVVSSSLGATIDGALSGMSASAYLSRQGYSQIAVLANDAQQTSSLASAISAMSYRTRDRSDLLNEVHVVFAILKGGLGAVGGIALIVAAVGIANTMVMTILERTREIGIMKALGAEPGTVRRLFLVETALVGVLGGVAGLLLATLGSIVGDAIFGRWVQGQGASNVGSIFVISPALALGALFLATTISLLGGALPSRRAVRLEPLDALRYE